MKLSQILTAGWFRCGTTHLFTLLRSVLPQWTHFYEPFHPNFNQWIQKYRTLKQQYPNRKIEFNFGTHDVDRLYQPYFNNLDIFDRWYNPAFGAYHYFLGQGSEFEEMKQYLQALSAQNHPAHFQINRGLGRLGFIADVFEQPGLIVLIRDPRAVWSSWQDQPNDPFDPDLTANKFNLQQMIKELEAASSKKEQKNCGLSTRNDHPPVYDFFIMWGLLYQMAVRDKQKYENNVVIRYEDLVKHPESALKQIGHQCNLNIRLKDLPTSRESAIDKWKQYASPDDYWSILNRLPDQSPTKDLMHEFDYLD